MSGQILLYILGAIGILLVIGTGGYLAHLRQRRRREELAGLAAEYGWRFDPSKDHSHDALYPQFSVFSEGHSRFAYNTIWGELRVGNSRQSAKLGDYHYQITTSTGKSTTTHTYRFSYIIVELPFKSLPDLSIRAEGFFDKLAGFIGFDDIDFESAEFSDRFHVKSSDKRFAYDVIHPRMMQFLLSTDPPTVALSGRMCCLDGGKKCWSAEQFRVRLAWAEEFFQHWPEHVLSALEA